MALQDLTPQIRQQLGIPRGFGGAVVVQVEQGSAAAGAGLRTRDVVLEVNGAPIRDAAQAAHARRRVGNGSTAFLFVWRDGQEQFLTMSRE